MRVQSEQHRKCSASVRETRRSSGFTLVELMVVIVIIALLVGLIMPAIFGAIQSARIAEVRTEISKLDAAISSFKAEYGGLEPPSSITFPPTTAAWNTPAYARSRQIVRRIWPSFDFATNGGAINASGTPTLTGNLNGAECLVFFLGGVRNGTSGPLVGFSKNAAQPFSLGGNRTGPFHEFDLGRLVEEGNNPDAPEYKDTLPSQSKPYIYLSSYDGKGYRAADIAAINTSPMSWTALAPTVASWYTQPGGSVAYKPSTHQIISPGPDTEYGTGGIYDADTDSAPSEEDRDNITNFSSGKLVP